MAIIGVHNRRSGSIKSLRMVRRLHHQLRYGTVLLIVRLPMVSRRQIKVHTSKGLPPAAIQIRRKTVSIESGTQHGFGRKLVCSDEMVRGELLE
jgi:hypothetical protein